MLYPRLLSLFCFILMLLVGATNAAKTERYAVCDRHLQASGDESVVSFEIHVTAGAFRGISNLPVGWGLVIDNDAPWRTKVTANTGVGAASLTPEEFKKVQFVIELHNRFCYRRRNSQS
ncbi:MAG: hypothetical protein ABSD98_14135 [Candidatus Korobacteraceae bacterium]